MIALGNMLEGLVGAYLVNRFAGGRSAFDRAENIFKFVFFAGIVSTAVSATIGVSSLILGGLAQFADSGPVWLTWWLGDMGGNLIVAPLLLLWSTKERIHWNQDRIFEAIVLFFTLVVSGVVAVLGGFSSYVFLSVPILIWAAFRFSQREAATAIFIVATGAIWATLFGFNAIPQGTAILNRSLLLLQALLGTIAVSILALAAMVSELKDSEAHFESLIERSSDVIALIDAQAQINYVSPSIVHVLGYTPKAFMAQNGFSWVHPDDVTHAQATLGEVIAKPGATARSDSRVRTKDGGWLWVEWVATNLLNEPAVKSIVVNFRDISERKEIEKAKGEFVTMASHELRTPLAIIKWYVEALLKRGKDQLSLRQTNYLGEVVHANERLIMLVNDLLGVSRIEVGTLAVEPKPTDLIALVKSVTRSLAPRIRKKGLKITLKENQELGAVSMDPRLMEVILHNLIVNAVQYTPQKGAIEIQIVQNIAGLLVRVSDTGCGIPAEEQGKIFTKFFRAAIARKMEPNGTGLGLYIVKSIVDLGGGKIWFESKVQKGTTFYVSFPPEGMKKKDGSRSLET